LAGRVVGETNAVDQDQGPAGAHAAKVDGLNTVLRAPATTGAGAALQADFRQARDELRS